MERKHDTVLTVAIGRNYGNNKTLTGGRWRNFRLKAKNLVGNHAKIVAATSGKGIGSDASRNDKPESTFVIVAINPVKTKQFRGNFSQLLRQYNQTSAAVAIDRKHKPVFNKNK